MAPGYPRMLRRLRGLTDGDSKDWGDMMKKIGWNLLGFLLLFVSIGLLELKFEEANFWKHLQYAIGMGTVVLGVNCWRKADKKDEDEIPED